jgi:hypothetical protein
MVDLRNRVAHHEPIVLRVRAVVTRRGEPQPPLAILRNASQGLDKFDDTVARVVALAATLAPRAAPDVENIPATVTTLLHPPRQRITTARISLEDARDRRPSS